MYFNLTLNDFDKYASILENNYKAQLCLYHFKRNLDQDNPLQNRKLQQVKNNERN